VGSRATTTKNFAAAQGASVRRRSSNGKTNGTKSKTTSTKSTSGLRTASTGVNNGLLLPTVSARVHIVFEGSWGTLRRVLFLLYTRLQM
jgi:hypothetical protein